jgi:putative transposase
MTCFRFSGPIIAGKFQFNGVYVIRAAGRGGTMKRLKFTAAQIAFILRQAEEGTAIGEVCRKAGISDAPFYSWHNKYAGLMPSEKKRLRQLEEENGKLKKNRGRPVARQGDAARRDPPKVLKPARQRQMMDYARSTWQVSIRRASRALPVERSATWPGSSRLTDQRHSARPDRS